MEIHTLLLLIHFHQLILFQLTQIFKLFLDKLINQIRKKHLIQKRDFY